MKVWMQSEDIEDTKENTLQSAQSESQSQLQQSEQLKTSQKNEKKEKEKEEEIHICFDPSIVNDKSFQEKAKEYKIDVNGLSNLLDSNYDITKVKKQCPIKGEEDDLFYVSDLLSTQECIKLIDKTEKLGYQYAEGFNKKVRSNQRRRTFDYEMSNIMMKRLSNILPKYKIIDGCKWELYGFTNYWRYLKYDSNEHFSPHYDGAKMFLNYSMSVYTVNIYLNSKQDNFKGGDTRFFMKCNPNSIENDWKCANQVTDIIEAETGGALIFNHCNKGYLHDGEPLNGGKKYIMRADIVYKCVDNDINKLKKCIKDSKCEYNEKNLDKLHGKMTKERGNLFYDYQCAKTHTVVNYIGRKWKCACISSDVTVTLF